MARRLTHSQMIFQALSKIGRGTCAQISVHCRLSYIDVEKKIYRLVDSGKVKVLIEKGGHSPEGKAANIYSIPKSDKEEVVNQGELF